MARIKREQDRDEKRDEIVAAARLLFVEEGYEATSISRLASAAGVAPNTIYWYFKDKDEVLVAVLDAELLARMGEYLVLPTMSPAERLLWVANQLERVSRLVGTVHSRLAQSPAINTWHDRFHAFSEEMLRLELGQAGIAPQKIAALVKISVFTIEGLLAHPLPEEQKRAICAALVTL
ncbi:MAG TPA: helix-turn-helix domain-containing protein [Candidatus Kapabacteria bacterium]|nr:helix-turn-helix domain-containing protein [Candidatus Kapabacteria bacterium]